MYVSSQAPKGKFRVMDIDYVDGDHRFLQDFEDLQTASAFADEKAMVRTGCFPQYSVFDDADIEQYRGKGQGVFKKDALLEMVRDHFSYVERKEMVAELLGHLNPTKPAGTALCDAIMRLWPTPAFEAMAFRLRQGVSEIYLRRRAPDDTAYPGQWHAPGSLYRHGEQDRDVATRLEKEFGVKIEKFELVGKEITAEARGTVHSLIFLVELAGEPRLDDRHQWFATNDLPEAMVDLHRDLIIPAATKVYWQRFLKR